MNHIRTAAVTRAPVLGRTAICLLAAAFTLLATTVPAGAAAEDCGGGAVQFLTGTGADLATIEAVEISGLGPACEGQVVGARFLGNDEGDVDLPTTVLAESYSDEDPCTGDDLAVARVVTNGLIVIPLCEASATAGFVDGHDLTDVRLITPAAVSTTDPDPIVDPDPVTDPDPTTDPGSTPDGAPDPGPDAGPMAATGIDGLLLATLGGLAMLLGAGMLRATRRRLTH